tara:strand:+ start:1142 stop:1420 length:279 start_codon:yes stop_codon:yes gene_type:complete
MNKKLLIGLGVGLVAYYFLMKKGKAGCECEKGVIEPDLKTQSDTDCEAHVNTLTKTMRFGSPEQRDAFVEKQMEICKSKHAKGIINASTIIR